MAKGRAGIGERGGKATYEEISLWKWASEEAGVLDCLLESWGKGSWHFECSFASIRQLFVSSSLDIRQNGRTICWDFVRSC